MSVVSSRPYIPSSMKMITMCESDDETNDLVQAVSEISKRDKARTQTKNKKTKKSKQKWGT